MAAVVLMTPACASGDGDAQETLGTASLVEGRGTLTHDGREEVLGSDMPVAAGDVVTVEGDGLARVRLRDARDLELRGGTLKVLAADTVALSAGSVLAQAGGAMEVRAGNAKARFATGTVRFDGPAVGRIGAYDAQSLEILSGDQAVELPRYWQLALRPDGRLDEAQPLQIDGDDSWDRRLLTGALETDANLANLATGFDAQFGTTTPPVLFERLAVIGIGAEALTPFAASPRSDIVLALAFTREAKKEASSELGQGFYEALTLNALGASWGLLAEQFGVDPARFIERFQAEINSIPIVPQPLPSPPAPVLPRRPRPVRPSPAPSPTASPVPPAPAASPGSSPAPGSSNPDSIIPLLPPELRVIIDELYGILEDLLPII